jgi:multidrug efflux pump subunit AcrA (membrane-fusion protein)
MMLTTSSLFSLSLVLALAAEPPRAEPQITDCTISAIDLQAVPAADAGVLASLNVKEGTVVKKGMEIGHIDDSEAKAMLTIKQLEYETANSTAESTIEIRAAEAKAEVADAALKKLEEANSKVRGSFTEIDILKTMLELKHSKLGIEQAKQKNTEARLTARAKKAEEGAAGVALERRILRAPFDGIIYKVAKRPGEWVAAGDAVVHIVGIDRLRVIGSVDPKEWAPADLDGRKVTVNVPLPHGKSVAVPGKVTYVSPMVVGDQEVVAEIEPPRNDGLPLVRAGLLATMTIHVNQPVVQATPPPAPLPAGPLKAPAATVKASATAPAKTSATGSSTSAPPAVKPKTTNTSPANPAAKPTGARSSTKK